MPAGWLFSAKQRCIKCERARQSPVAVSIYCSIWQLSYHCDVELHLMGQIQGGAPYRSYATLAASTYIRSGSSPNQGPSYNVARAEGAPRRMGPIFRTASCRQAPGRSHIHLGSVCSSRQSSSLHAVINPSERRPPAPRRFRGSATGRSKACVPRPRQRCAGCGPWQSRPARGTRLLRGLSG